MEGQKGRQCCRSGFTLIEVILTVALGVAVLSIKPLFSGNFFFSREVFVVQEELQGSFIKAQMYSIAGKDNDIWGVAFRPNERKIVLFRGNTFATRDQSRDEVYEVGPQVTLSGFNEVVFARVTGKPSSEPTIVLSGSGQQDTFSLNSEGIFSQE